jgi:hypothetical protein
VRRGAGFVARWRARRGIKHPSKGVALGYRSGLERVLLSRKELGHHGAVFGAPGSGKTTLLSLIVQGHSRLGPCIVIDGKGSASMRRAIAAAGGLVWTIGGKLKLDLLDDDPTVLAEQLTEAARHEGPAEVFTEAAARAIQWIGHMHAWEGRQPTLESVEALLHPESLKASLARHSGRYRVAQWQAELAGAGATELSGMATALMRVTRLIDSAAGPSLGAGIDAARLDDVVQGKTTLLLSLDSMRYPSLARILGAWALIAMQRACGSVPRGVTALCVIDEVGALGKHARHVEPLLAKAREAGVGVVVASHGPAQLEMAVHGLANQVMQEAAWVVCMAQGDPDDADQLSRLFPLDEGKPITVGKHASGVPRKVTRDTLMWLGTGDCAYRIRPVDGLNGRWGLARVAMPETLPEVSVPPRPALLALPPGPKSEKAAPNHPPTDETETTEAELKQMVYGRVIRTEGGWRAWPKGGSWDPKGYPRQWVSRQKRDPKTGAWIGGFEPVHRWVYTWEVGPIPKGWSVDHVCNLKWCLDHLEAVTVGENTRRRHARARGELPTGHEHYAKAA